MPDESEDLFQWAERNTAHFDGETYESDLDHGRLAAQLHAVRQFMADGQWRRLAEISEAVGAPEASVSARLRDLRKDKFGAHAVARRRCAPGTFEYRVEPKEIAK